MRRFFSALRRASWQSRLLPAALSQVRHRDAPDILHDLVLLDGLELLYDLGDPERIAQNDLEPRREVLVPLTVAFDQELDVADDRGQRVVDLVTHRDHDLSDRAEPLSPQELFPHQLLFRNVPGGYLVAGGRPLPGEPAGAQLDEGPGPVAPDHFKLHHLAGRDVLAAEHPPGRLGAFGRQEVEHVLADEFGLAVAGKFFRLLVYRRQDAGTVG